jgi:hypothetical protein
LIHVRVPSGLLHVSWYDGGFGTEKLMRAGLAIAVSPGMRVVSFSVVLVGANNLLTVLTLHYLRTTGPKLRELE